MQIEVGDHTWRFEIVGDAHVDDEHPRFVCTERGIIYAAQHVTGGHNTAAVDGRPGAD